MVTFPMTLTDSSTVFKVTAFLKSNISKTSRLHKRKVYQHMEWCYMFGDLDWPLNASRGFVSISWACCFTARRCV